jgi:hypothetical protein
MTLFSICKIFHYIDNDIIFWCNNLASEIYIIYIYEIYLPSSTARVSDMPFVAAQPTLLADVYLTVIREWSAGHWQIDVEFLYQGN